MSHYSLTDDQFEYQFERCAVDPAIFTHEAHLRLAWIHISKYGIDQAIVHIQTQLQAYTKQVGASSKYNTTVTIAACKAVYHFMLQSDRLSFQQFIQNNERLKNNFKELMQAHYKTNIFQSEIARSGYLEPELLPFD